MTGPGGLPSPARSGGSIFVLHGLRRLLYSRTLLIGEVRPCTLRPMSDKSQSDPPDLQNQRPVEAATDASGVSVTHLPP